MKRYGNLFEKVVSWENLIHAARRSGRGKPMTPERAEFEFNRESEITCLRREMITSIYYPGAYQTFVVYDPKKRLVSAAPYRDRVVHHAICNVIKPIFDQTFLPQNCANRKGRGLHWGVKIDSLIVNASWYILKADIWKYFPSIDHQLIKEKIHSKIKCRRTLDLLNRIIDGSNEQETARFFLPGDDLFAPFERRKGLPIGNLTSQLFVNVCLKGLDRFIVQKMKLASYVRYVDDFLIG